MRRGRGRSVCAVGAVLSLCAASALARADVGDTTDALPGVVRVPVLSPSARGLAVGASAGYGYTEGVLGKGDSYSRASGSLAVSYQPFSYFAAAFRIDGRYDTDTGSHAASGGTGDPRLELRFMRPLSDALRLGAQLGVWAPGGQAPSFQASAITPDLSVLATYAPSDSPLTLTSRLGFRWDNSTESVTNAGQLALPDRVELGLNQASAVLTGIGADYRLFPRVELLGDLTWDLLVGSAAPSVVDAPILLSAGGRYTLDADGKIQMQAVLTVSPSGRPTVSASSPLVDIEPRVSLFCGLVLRPFAKRPEVAAPTAAQPATPAAVVAPPAAPVRAKLKGRATADDGHTALAHAHVVVTPANGAEPQELDTDDDGNFETRDLDFGDVSVTISAKGFTPVHKTVTISSTPAPLDVVATRALPPGEVRGVVRNFDGKPVKATIQIDPGGITVTLAADGTFHADVQPGAYKVVIRAPGYVDQTRHVSVERNAVILLNVELRKQAR